ncbi:hypothetical protein CsatB_009477 [Cannabis sativa]|nr:probable protein phosphatase 2C 25 [Cannabis sativa]
MPCAVAIPNSPIFSPTNVSSIFFKSQPSSSSSPRLIKVQCSNSVSTSTTQSTTSSPLAGRIQRNRPPSSTSNMGLGSCSGEVLKRKRPSRISIPMAPLSFTIDSPKGSSDVVEDESDGYSVYCKRGRRAVMEDRYSAIVDHRAESRQAFFGVFDGHGGVSAAEFVAKNLDSNIVNHLKNCSEDDIGEAVKGGYLTTDKDFLKEGVNGGTCCVTALIQKHNLVVSNAGDCRAVMSRGGVAEALTTDHRPSRKDEKDRIENLGGYVDCCNGVWRIQGSLAVSRGIGDRHLKEWVIAEPETKVLEIKPECEFLILGSDGLWDKITNQEAVDIVRPLCIGVDKPEPLSACKKLVELSVKKGSIDDISVVVIPLGQFI